MSDAVEIFRAMKDVRREEREDCWSKRADWLSELHGLGLRAEVLNETARHCRVWIEGQGCFDFWPSSGKWKQSPRENGRRGKRGLGLPELVACLREIIG